MRQVRTLASRDCHLERDGGQGSFRARCAGTPIARVRTGLRSSPDRGVLYEGRPVESGVEGSWVMPAVRLWFCAELRARWRAWLGLALVDRPGRRRGRRRGSGARRTDSAYQRFLDEQRAVDVFAIADFCPGPEDLEPGEEPYDCDVTKVADLPQVSEAAVVESLSADVRTADGRSLQPGGDPNYTGPGEVNVLGSSDGAFGGRLNRLRVLDGRLPRTALPTRSRCRRHSRSGRRQRR